MSLVQIYQCLCDQTRLRILHLLGQGPLCVCHIQAALAEPQVKISKHLAYLKTRGMVNVRREANWMIYSLPTKGARELQANLACLQDCVSEDPLFRRDSERLRRRVGKVAEVDSTCCPPTPSKRRLSSKS
ncbi:MAG TPA: metalloregulator ArsR/SmtB family transcription factor [Candidatus Didemnitutus sp.]|nr:metalloregulator ArsR/SmtB family transcription factor [Candidatus Didemnitutus sp.]